VGVSAALANQIGCRDLCNIDQWRAHRDNGEVDFVSEPRSKIFSNYRPLKFALSLPRHLGAADRIVSRGTSRVISILKCGTKSGRLGAASMGYASMVPRHDAPHGGGRSVSQFDARRGNTEDRLQLINLWLAFTVQFCSWTTTQHMVNALRARYIRAAPASLFNFGLVMQDDIQQRTVNLNIPIVLDET